MDCLPLFLVLELHASPCYRHNSQGTCRCFALLPCIYKMIGEIVGCADSSPNCHRQGSTDLDSHAAVTASRGGVTVDLEDTTTEGIVSSRSSCSTRAAAKPKVRWSWSVSMTTFDHLQDMVTQNFLPGWRVHRWLYIFLKIQLG